MREVCNAEWDDIQDRLKEKDAENERLKALLKDRMYELKSLLSRAADALDIMTQFLLISDVPLEWEENKRKENKALIAELRKVAE